MPLNVFLLVLMAAALHAGWNVALRRVSGHMGVLWLSFSLGALLAVPVAVAVQPSWDSLVAGLPCIVATGVIHALYFLFLGRAYRTGEVSVVYPLARGSGVAGTAIVAGVFFADKITALGSIGIAAVCAGVFLLARRSHGARHHTRAVVDGLLVGATIIAYSVVDKHGVGIVHPVVYIVCMILLAMLLMTPYMLMRQRVAILDALLRKRRTVLILGPCAVSTYLVILFAYRLAPLGYVVATRESSVVIATLLGVALLGERLTVRRGLAVAAIALGVALIKLA